MAYTLKEIFEALGKIENGGAMVANLRAAICQILAVRCKQYNKN